MPLYETTDQGLQAILPGFESRQKRREPVPDPGPLFAALAEPEPDPEAGR